MTRSKKTAHKTGALNRIRISPLRQSILENNDPLWRVYKIIESRDLPLQYPANVVTKKKLPTLKDVRDKFVRGEYKANAPWKFIKEMNNVFDTVKSHWSSRTTNHQKAIQMQEFFGNQMDILMEALGYCCGRFYMLHPRETLCDGRPRCSVKPGQLLYRYKNSTFCHDCFLSKDDLIKVEDEWTHKSVFKEYHCKFSRQEYFVHCKLCHRKLHQICALHDQSNDGPYCCPTCRKDHGIERLSIRAKNLPSTKCDRHIENFLEHHKLSKEYNITVRLLSESTSTLQVKQRIQEFRDISSEYNVRNWNLFTFFDPGDGNDICFFSAIVQLYGNDCNGPNKNTAYICYIDSVNFLPSGQRTKIYRYILLGLFQYLKLNGFDRIHLWSCPPKPNCDYIFNTKPPGMKIPTRERLSKWYIDFLNLGVSTKVISSFKGIHDVITDDQWKCLNDVPYLEGDLWSARMDEFIGNIKKQVKQLQEKLEKAQIRLERMKNKLTKTAVELKSRIDRTIEEQEELDVQSELWEMMKLEFMGFHNEYFVIKLDGSSNKLRTIKRETIERQWLDRHDFMDYMCNEMLEFSSERRAKHSSRQMLQQLFLESRRCVKCGLYSPDGLVHCAYYPEISLLCPRCAEDKIKSLKTVWLGFRFAQNNVQPTDSLAKRTQDVVVINREHDYSAEDVRVPINVNMSFDDLSADSAYNSGDSPDSLDREYKLDGNCNRKYKQNGDSEMKKVGSSQNKDREDRNETSHMSETSGSDGEMSGESLMSLGEEVIYIVSD